MIGLNLLIIYTTVVVKLSLGSSQLYQLPNQNKMLLFKVKYNTIKNSWMYEKQFVLINNYKESKIIASWGIQGFKIFFIMLIKYQMLVKYLAYLQLEGLLL